MGQRNILNGLASFPAGAGIVLRQDVFNEHGVQIMTPSYVADPPDAKVVPKERWHADPAAPPASKPAAGSD